MPWCLGSTHLHIFMGLGEKNEKRQQPAISNGALVMAGRTPPVKKLGPLGGVTSQLLTDR